MKVSVFLLTAALVPAALVAQQDLQTEPWGAVGPVRVRIALHTGAAEQRGGDYFGPTLSRVARLLQELDGPSDGARVRLHPVELVRRESTGLRRAAVGGR